MTFYYKILIRIYRNGNKQSAPETVEAYVMAGNTAQAYQKAQAIKSRLDNVRSSDTVVCTRKDVICRLKQQALAEIASGVRLYEEPLPDNG